MAILQTLWKWPLNTASILTNFKSLMKKIFEKGCWWWSIRFSHATLFWALNWDKNHGNLLFSVKGLGSKLSFFGPFQRRGTWFNATHTCQMPHYPLKWHIFAVSLCSLVIAYCLLSPAVTPTNGTIALYG